MSLFSDSPPPAKPSRPAEEPRPGDATLQRKWFVYYWLPPVLMGIALVAALGGAGWFSVKFFGGGKEKPAVISQPPQTPAPLPGVASVLPGTTTPVTAKAAPAAKPEGAQPVTLQMIAKTEAARQAKPAGPLYEKQSQPVALSFTGVKLDAPEVKEAQEVLAEFLKTAAWQERLRLVFHPEITEARMQEYYEKRGLHDPEQGALLGAGYIAAGDSRVLNLQFACPTRPEAGLRANFHQTRGGKLLLDWESWSAWCEMDWPDFKKERSAREVTMRAIASESSYYNYEFSDPWNWLAVKLRSADGLHTVTGYIQRNTALGIALANLIGVPIPHQLPADAPLPAIKPAGSKSLVTLRLRYPVNAQSNSCVLITDMLADRWLLFPGEEK